MVPHFYNFMLVEFLRAIVETSIKDGRKRDKKESVVYDVNQLASA